LLPVRFSLFGAGADEDRGDALFFVEAEDQATVDRANDILALVGVVFVGLFVGALDRLAAGADADAAAGFELAAFAGRDRVDAPRAGLFDRRKADGQAFWG
jgi:hypothetical protein